ncbi:hypothetical protein [Sphingobium arseniciresistens]|uniref:hypothetical protein n=1 Tax=Sphingobium arseniciresistens TaxID=3030834 RepID=UPI0023B8F0FD
MIAYDNALTKLLGTRPRPCLAMTLALSAVVDREIAEHRCSKWFTKALKWSEEADPLVIDLDDDGIETISLSNSKAYFDVDGDLFAERTERGLAKLAADENFYNAQFAWEAA